MYIVTGGTGLVGAHVLLRLVQQHKPVKALYRKSSRFDVPKKVFKANIDPDWKSAFETIEWIPGNILDPLSLHEIFQPGDKVLHCAGFVSYQIHDKQKLMDINHIGTQNVVNAGLEKEIAKLVYVSSTAALGHTHEDLVDENTEWKEGKSLTNYAISKHLAELEVWRGMEEGLNSIIVNPSVIFGFGNSHKGSTQIFTQIKNGLKFYTNGSSGFVDVFDVADAMITLMEGNISGERFILNEGNYTFKEIFQMIAEAFGIKGSQVEAKPWMSEIYWRWSWLKSKILGSENIITRETARQAYYHRRYNNQKIIAATGHNFIPMKLTIQRIVENMNKYDFKPGGY